MCNWSRCSLAFLLCGGLCLYAQSWASAACVLSPTSPHTQQLWEALSEPSRSTSTAPPAHATPTVTLLHIWASIMTRSPVPIWRTSLLWMFYEDEAFQTWERTCSPKQKGHTRFTAMRCFKSFYKHARSDGIHEIRAAYLNTSPSTLPTWRRYFQDSWAECASVNCLFRKGKDLYGAPNVKYTA